MSTPTTSTPCRARIFVNTPLPQPRSRTRAGGLRPAKSRHAATIRSFVAGLKTSYAAEFAIPSKKAISTSLSCTGINALHQFEHRQHADLQHGAKRARADLVLDLVDG